MKTVWGEAINPNAILQEYPRPQMMRESYFNLNGRWQYAIVKAGETPMQPDGEILVPFSPESELSGVQRTLKPKEILWYMRSFVLPQGFQVGRVLLHFGAVDQSAMVYINGAEVGTHTGGYLPFSFDITSYLKEGENLLTVCVRDESDAAFHARGKQKRRRG